MTQEMEPSWERDYFPKERQSNVWRDVFELQENPAKTDKPSNPKDSVGVLKAPLSTVSAPAPAERHDAMGGGARK